MRESEGTGPVEASRAMREVLERRQVEGTVIASDGSEHDLFPVREPNTVTEHDRR